MIAMSARSWLSAADDGFCDVTQSRGDCRTGSKGSSRLSFSNSTSWPVAVAACLDVCSACARCNYISVSLAHRDCSWFRPCDTEQLRQDTDGFRSGAARPAAKMHELPAAELWVAVGVVLGPSTRTLKPEQLRRQSWMSQKNGTVTWRYVTSSVLSNSSWRRDRLFVVTPCRDGPFKAGGSAYRRRPQATMTADDAYSAMQGACACKTIWWFWRAPVLFPAARYIAKVEEDSVLHDARLVSDLMAMGIGASLQPVWLSQFQWAGTDSIRNGWFCGDGDDFMLRDGPPDCPSIDPSDDPASRKRLREAKALARSWGQQRLIFPFAAGGLDVRSRSLVDALADCDDALPYAHAWSTEGAHGTAHRPSRRLSARRQATPPDRTATQHRQHTATTHAQLASRLYDVRARC
jgi:hypothetical protein